MLPASLPIPCLLDPRVERDARCSGHHTMSQLPSGKFLIMAFMAWLLGSVGEPILSTMFLINDLTPRGQFYRELSDNFTREINES